MLMLRQQIYREAEFEQGTGQISRAGFSMYMVIYPVPTKAFGVIIPQNTFYLGSRGNSMMS